MSHHSEEGLKESSLERRADQIGIVSVHCWNLGEEDGPYPFTPGNRSLGKIEDWVPRAQQIVRDRIAPVLTAAREAGVAVFHLCVHSYARRYPTYDSIVSDPDLAAPAPVEPTDVCVNPRTEEERLHDLVGSDWPGAPWQTHTQTFDIARAVRPLADEPVVLDGWQLNGLCRRAGIDTLIYAGFMADICVQHIPGAVREMAEKFRYWTVVLRDCTTAYEYPETYEQNWMTFAAIRTVESSAGFTSTSDQLIAAITRARG